MAEFSASAPQNLVPDGGVQKIIIKPGDGLQCPPGAFVNVHYVGRFPNGGEIFDSSRRKGRVFQFAVGQGMVIKGWDLGVASMQRGELCTLTCTAPYAYGSQGAGGGLIPPGATLEFEVELLGWKGEPTKEGEPAPAAGRCSLA